MNAQEYLQDKISDVASDLEIEKDTGWSDPVRGGRCIKDYSRQVTFSRELEREELQKINAIMHEDKNCPGWTGVSGYRKNDEELLYMFSTTWDSSD